jgi:hypothetical protein
MQDLSACDSGRGEFFVEPRLENDPRSIQQTGGSAQLHIQASQWRPLVAADEHTGVQTARLIKSTLFQSQSDQRLNTGHENAAMIGGVLVVE